MYKIRDDEDRTLSECFDLFKLIYELTDSEESIRRIAREVVVDFAADGVVYLELRTTPRCVMPSMSLERYVEVVLEGVEQARVMYPEIQVKLLLSINRSFTVDVAESIVDLALKFTDRGVVGIDLSGNPQLGDFSTWVVPLERARKAGLGLAIHAAEIRNEKETDAIIAFAPDRIGHGVYMTDTQIEAMFSRNIGLEVCLTSNFKTQSITHALDHPFAELHPREHLCAVCTDDSGVFSTSLSQEMALALEALNGTLPIEGVKFALAAARLSFLTPPEKEQLIRRIETMAADLFSE
jgi:adenosine deaminase